MFSKVILLVILAIVASVAAQSTGPKHNKTVVCYISTWAVYRPSRGSYSIDNFDPNLCTIAIYAFAGLDPENDAIKSLDPWQDLEDNGGKGGFKRLTSLKATHPHLKVLLAIGGWNEGSANYSQLAQHPLRRANFVKQSSEYIRKHNFDGLDLDWEYPTQRGGSPQDKEAFVLLVEELYKEYKKHNLHLSSAFGAAKKTIDSAYNIKKLSQSLDTMHIMCYDYFGSWDKKIGLNAPIENDNELNVDFSIEYFIKLGAPAEKLIMGLPFYGRTFITNKDGNLGDESDDTGFQGPFTRENGFMGYNEICLGLSNTTSEWKADWHVQSSEAIARLRELTETKVVTYDSSRSIANKVRHAMRKNLGGLMVWSIDTDDFNGDCAPEYDAFVDFREMPGIKLKFPARKGKNYPLLRTLNEAIIVSVDEMVQEQSINDKDNEIDNNNNSNQIPPNNKDKNEPASANCILINSFIILAVAAFLTKLF